MIDPYENCPQFETEHFIIRLLDKKDTAALFDCYGDHTVVDLMNDDNCDFGFYQSNMMQMSDTVDYWLEGYKKKWFVRFSIINKATDKPIGTLEGFNSDTGVFRLDICRIYERSDYLQELLSFARQNFYSLFGNIRLVTKAIALAHERQTALINCGWNYINNYLGYSDYFCTDCRQ